MGARAPRPPLVVRSKPNLGPAPPEWSHWDTIEPALREDMPNVATLPLVAPQVSHPFGAEKRWAALSAAQREAFYKNGFVALDKPSAIDDEGDSASIAEIYEDAEKDKTPAFLTADALFFVAQSAVDRAVAVLEQAGLTSFFVQAGGDLYARGKKPDGSAWSAGVKDPRGKAPFALLPLTDHAFSTAGDYERSYIVDGRRFHHIIDPKSGYPAKSSRSVTIWAKTALMADEIDDAVFVMGPEKGMELVESLDGVGAIIVDVHNHVWISKRLQGNVRITAAPTDGL